MMVSQNFAGRHGQEIVLPALAAQYHVLVTPGGVRNIIENSLMQGGQRTNYE